MSENTKDFAHSPKLTTFADCPQNVVDLVKEIQNNTLLKDLYVSISFWDHLKYFDVYTSSHGYSDPMTSYVELINYLTDFLASRKILFRRFDI